METAKRCTYFYFSNMLSCFSFFSTSSEPSEVINVFSLASGHLYERFMKIMMVSVMKNTKSQKVKFWLLKNYLSPKFKETIPSLAEFYGFDYELVEYKWPKWLHRQTEKQRVMWGYKVRGNGNDFQVILSFQILFLDVLFPLSVDKIIFVDADQVVRADLQELMDYNLKGAPYGYNEDSRTTDSRPFRYVPFCESRQEMDGFRFWNSGYWKQHLAGKRYHISALYVVDLKVRPFLSSVSVKFCSSRSSDCSLLEIAFVVGTVHSQLILIVCPTWIKIFRTTWFTRFRSELCRKNGFGARLGATMKARRTRRQLTW